MMKLALLASAATAIHAFATLPVTTCPAPRVAFERSCPCPESERQYLHDGQGCRSECYCKGVRMEINELSEARHSELIDAFLKLKTTPSPWQRGMGGDASADYTGLTWYDTLVAIHASSLPTNYFAHQNPAFGSWHRVLLQVLELGLNEVLDYPQPPVAMAYWDWTKRDSSTEKLFSPSGIGSNGSNASTECVLDGPFKNWEMTIFSEGFAQRPQCLRRTLGKDRPALPTQDEVVSAVAIRSFAVSPWAFVASVEPQFQSSYENIHNHVHVWVGGAMMPLTSPNDPAFFLHHCNVDRFYESWLASHSNPNGEAEFPVGLTKIVLPEGLRVRYIEMPTATGFIVGDGSAEDLESFYELTFAQMDRDAGITYGTDEIAGFTGKWLGVAINGAQPDGKTVFRDGNGVTYQAFQLGVERETYYNYTEHMDRELPLWNAHGTALLTGWVGIISPAGFDNAGGTKAVVCLPGGDLILPGQYSHTHKSLDGWLSRLFAGQPAVAVLMGGYVNPLVAFIPEEHLDWLRRHGVEVSSSAELAQLRVLEYASHEVVLSTDEGGEWIASMKDVHGEPAKQALVVTFDNSPTIEVAGVKVSYLEACRFMVNALTGNEEQANSICAFHKFARLAFPALLHDEHSDEQTWEPFSFHGMDGYSVDITDKLYNSGAGPGHNRDDYLGLFTEGINIWETVSDQHKRSRRYDMLYNPSGDPPQIPDTSV